MLWPFKKAYSSENGRHGRGFLPSVGAAVCAGVFLTVFSAPAPALDSAESRKTSPTEQLPIFKDPQAALRAGIESYHAGNASHSVEALRYAAESGESLAQWKLGRMYADGDGVTRDDAKAYDYFSKIVEHFADDDPEPGARSMASSAFVSVGVYLRDGVAAAKIAPDPARAFDLFRYAATFFRDSDAQYNLARMYLEGRGVKKDVRQAISWLDLAARKSHPQAQAMLGQLMFNGDVGGAAQRPRGLMYLSLARNTVGDNPSHHWIVDLHAKALETASDADRKTALGMLEAYMHH